MTLDRDKITLSVTSPENGTAAEEVPGAFQGEGFDIGFNARYLLDILGQIDSDLVELHLADAAAPTLIRADDRSPALYEIGRASCRERVCQSVSISVDAETLKKK